MLDIFKIFGSSVRVSGDDSPAGTLLRRELELSPAGSPDEACDLEIVQGRIPAPARGLVNPSIHSELDDGFIAQFGPATVRWQFERDRTLRRVYFHLSGGDASASRRQLQRMRSNQFTSAAEKIGQVFHELVMVPSAYFLPGRILLHASALQDSRGVTLVGGTGGVGKTSLELELCRNHGYRFVADDVAVLSEGGHVWPNLAFPKIYGYNLEGERELSRILLGNRGLGDRLLWRMHASRGLHRVRRRISPVELYGGYSPSGGPLRKYVFISRELRDDFVVEPVNPAAMAALSLPVMKAEYEIFHRHLEWHRMNRQLMGETTTFTTEAVFQRWADGVVRALDGVVCHVVHAPKNIAHEEFRSKMSALVLE
jgi:hypothetical protein